MMHPMCENGGFLFCFRFLQLALPKAYDAAERTGRMGVQAQGLVGRLVETCVELITRSHYVHVEIVPVLRREVCPSPQLSSPRLG
jgi:hypothetical protein